MSMKNYTREDILNLVEEEDVGFIRLQFTDIFGTMKNVAITVSQLKRALDNKCMFDGSSIEGFARIEESDMYLHPDLNTFEIFPWRPQQGKVARFICDIYRPDGTAYESDPRYVLKNISRIAFVSCSIRSVNIADKSCNLSLLRPPRKNFKCIQIRVQIHIRFFDSGKSFYRRSIKHTFIIQCSFKLAYCNRYILHCSENIGELQPDKSHVFFLDKIQDIFSRIIFHTHTNPPVFTTHK